MIEHAALGSGREGLLVEDSLTSGTHGEPCSPSSSGSDDGMTYMDMQRHVADALSRINRLQEMGFNSEHHRVLFVKWTIAHWEQQHPANGATRSFAGGACQPSLDAAAEKAFSTPSEVEMAPSTCRPRRQNKTNGKVRLGEIRGPGSVIVKGRGLKGKRSAGRSQMQRSPVRHALDPHILPREPADSTRAPWQPTSEASSFTTQARAEQEHEDSSLQLSPFRYESVSSGSFTSFDSFSTSGVEDLDDDYEKYFRQPKFT